MKTVVRASKKVSKLCIGGAPLSMSISSLSLNLALFAKISRPIRVYVKMTRNSRTEKLATSVSVPNCLEEIV